MESFSVLMSVYAKERADLLDRALKSVLVDSTVLPSELVLVEDGPLPGELSAVIGKYRRDFPVLVSVKLPRNGGLGKALDTGLRYCCNEWVARMDSDDISLPVRFEKQLRYIGSHPEVDVLGCALGEFTDDEQKVNAVKYCPEDIASYIKFRSPVNHATVFFKKSSVLKAGGYRHCHFMEDYHLWIRMYAMGMRLTSMRDILYLCKMDACAHKRRGGWKYVVSESEIQLLLLRKHVISFPRYCMNMFIRCGGRLLPGSLRSVLYRTCLRSRSPKLPPESTVSCHNEVESYG